jgi:hypothetical protein
VTSPWFSPGPDDAPITYTVQGQHVEEVTAAYTEFDASAAGQDILPALIYRSQAGNIIGVYTTDEVVADGDFVQVSWAPFLRAATAGGGGGGAIAGLAQMWFSQPLFADSMVSIPAGGNTNVPFANTFTTDPNIASFDSVANPNDTLVLNSKSHLYLISGAAYWQLAGFVQQTILNTQAATIVGGELLGDISGHAIHPADYFNIIQPIAGVTQGPIDYMIVIPQVAGQAVTLNALHNSGTAKNLIQGFVACVAWALP